MERTIYKETTSTVTLDNEGIERIGKQFTEGVVTTLAKWFVIGMLVALAFSFAVEALGLGAWDGTDDRAAGQRSGMRLRTDHGTGCQYLETRDGGITPRLTRDGKQYCN